MRLHTASEIISFAKELESQAAKFYEDASQRFTKDGNVFLTFAKENAKNESQIERTYYGVITDAIESCFAFNIESDEYTFETELTESASYPDALNKATEMEKKMVKFYSDAAEQSRSLMADVPRTFTLIAKKGGNRELQLRSLLEGGG